MKQLNFVPKILIIAVFFFAALNGCDKSTENTNKQTSISDSNAVNNSNNNIDYPHLKDNRIEKVMYDTNDNVVGIVIKTKSGEKEVMLNEERVIECARTEIESKKISKEEYVKSLRKYLITGETKALLSGVCWVVVYCNNPNHAPGCGWWQQVPCDGNWGLDRPR